MHMVTHWQGNLLSRSMAWFNVTMAFGIGIGSLVGAKLMMAYPMQSLATVFVLSTVGRILPSYLCYFDRWAICKIVQVPNEY